MDMESIPEPVWREAEKRAAALRPLAALEEAPADLVRDAARDLNLSERWTYILIRRLRDHGGELTALLPRQGRGAPRKNRISSDREAIISEVIELDAIFARVRVEIKAQMATPEGRREIESMSARSASQMGAPAGDGRM